MALWLVRIGRHGEHEEKFLQTSRVYLTWRRLSSDLSKLSDKPALRELLANVFPDAPVGRLSNFTGQIWAFAKEMKPGDWLVIPSKKKAAMHIAEITGGYTHHPDAEDPYYHSRSIRWIQTDVPRTSFDRDLLYSFGAIMTICQIRRHDAEKRVRAMAKQSWKPVPIGPNPDPVVDGGGDESDAASVDLEERGRDQIAQVISRKFTGHDLTRLVDALLKAQGYTTYRSPPGPDKGIDILAAPEPLGFGQPRICVQVKSGDTPVDTPTLNQLIGSMQNVHADQGLLVSWGGFKSSVDKEIPAQFFRVRVWDQKVLIDELLTHYHKLDPDLRAELPLKQIWTVAVEDDEE